jgi:hypothetical protein
MSPNYIEYCKKYPKLTAMTMFKYHKDPEPYDNSYPYYAYKDRHMVGSGDPTARIMLLYALRSYPKKNDSSKYTLYVIATDGIYTEEIGFHSQVDEPIRFCNLYLTKLSDYSSHGFLIINKPDTRSIIIMPKYSYQEIINDISYPNSYDFIYHKDEFKPGEISSHILRIHDESTYQTYDLEYSTELYKAIKANQSYLHLRSDNYIDFYLLDTYHPSF